MKEKLAENLYHGKEGYNCTQAILKTFQKEFKVEDGTITSAANLGRGKAINGTCGAFYAAFLLVKHDTLQEKFKETFIAEAGSIYCNDIRLSKRLSCKGCVKLAAKTIQKIL